MTMILAKLVMIGVVLFCATSTADIISLKLRSDKRHTITFSEFGFSGNRGYVSFLISSVTATSSRPDPSRIGFVLESREVQNQRRFPFLKNTTCPLDIKLNIVLFTFQDLDANATQSSFNKSYHVTHPGMYSLSLANCNEGESLITMDGRAELYNIINGGSTRNYLSAEQKRLPFLFFLSSLVYLCFLSIWILVCIRNQRSLNLVHLLMGALLVINSAQIICAAADLYCVKVTGTGTPHGLNILFHTAQLLRNVVLDTVIVLIFTGWCFWKQFLEVKEMLVLMIVIVLQVLGNVYGILAWEHKGPTDSEIASPVIGFVCSFALFIPMGWSIGSLKKKFDRNSYINRAKLSIFGFVLLVSMMFKIVAPLEITPFTWVDYGVQEINIFVICVLMFFIFMPFDRDDNDERALQMA